VKEPLLVLASLAAISLLCAAPISSLLGTALSRYSEDKLPEAQSITLPPGYFVPVEVNSLSNSTWIDYDVQSNLSISTALMNSNQFNIFNNSQSDDMSNSINNQKGTSAQGDFRVSFGPYFLVFYNYQQSGTANVSFTYLTYPFTPFVAGPIVPPAPTGLASFGLYNISGNAVPYAIETPSIMGAANITSIQAYNVSAPAVNDTVSGATLQLNAVVVAKNANGSEQDYWIQNTPDFVTNASQISYNDNVWNNTDLSGFLSNQTVTSPNGPSVFPTGDNQTQAQYFYAYGTNNYTYVEPFDIDLYLNESVLSGKGVLVQMGVQILRNGTVVSPAAVFWYDNITISDPSVQSAYYYIDGNDSTPIGSYYDAELVFGGEGNLEETNFTQMNSTLGLYYLNTSSDALSPFPSYYSFGGDTGEAADNLHVNYFGNGTAELVLGKPNYVYLNAVSNATSTASSTRSLMTTTTSGSSSQIVSTMSSVSSNTGASGISNDYFLILIPVVVIMLFAILFVSRRKKFDPGN